MHVLHFVELLIQLLSMTTATIVISRILMYDKLKMVTKLCISLIYSSAFVTDTAVIVIVYNKIMKQQLLLYYDDVVSEVWQPFRQATFAHEIGTWIYVWGVILTATERLLNGHFNTELSCSCGVMLATPLFLCIIGVTSYYSTSWLLSEEHQHLAGGIIVFSQIFGIVALLYTLYLNRRRYRATVGEDLEQRYKRSYIYKFNRAVLKSLIGEVVTRSTAFTGVIAITHGVRENTPCGWLAFMYLNLIPVGNIVFPWFIILRHLKVDFSRICGAPRSNVVKDLNGRDLKMSETADQHFEALNRLWN